MNDPIDNITWMPAEKLNANNYNPNVVFNQELRLLERSLIKTGWFQPILVNINLIIIDGFHRWMLSQESHEIKAKYKGQVPVAKLDIDDSQAMCMTVRVNRAKGTHVALKMSEIVQKLINEHNLDPKQVADEIGATPDEIALLYQASIFKRKNLSEYRYSRAWIPKEQR
jgi:ParB-like chromosome segregation protein Spo0J